MAQLTITLEDHSNGRRWDADALERLLDCIAEMGLAAACSLSGMPKRRTVLAWARRSPEWRTALEAAQDDYARLLVDEAIERADSAQDKESAACARIQSDVRLKAAAMLSPGVYGKERGGVDAGGVVVTLLRLAAQGIQDRRALEAVPLKPLTGGADTYTGRDTNENGYAAASGTLAGPGGGKGTRDETGTGGAPRTPVAPLSPGPANTPGQNPEVSYTQVAMDRMIVTIPDELPDEIDILSGVAGNMDLDEPLPA